MPDNDVGALSLSEKANALLGAGDVGLSMLSRIPGQVVGGLGGLGVMMQGGDMDSAAATVQRGQEMVPGWEPFTASGKRIAGAIPQAAQNLDTAAGHTLAPSQNKTATELGNKYLGPAAMAGITAAAAIPFPETRGAAALDAALPHATSARLYHWSHEPDLAVTDPAKYGTGLKGEEAPRVKYGGAPQRTYFYTQPSTKEAGLGPHQYVADVHGLYNAEEDPAHFYDDALKNNTQPEDAQINPGVVDHHQAYSDYESAVKGAGYSGMVYPKTGAAALFHKQEVAPAAAVSPIDPLLAHESLKSGGFSVHPDTGEIPTSGYMYSPYPEHSLTIPGVASPDDIMQYANSKRGVLNQDPRNHVGGWMENGNTVLDVSRNEPNLQTAASDALNANQRAIFDLNNMQEIGRQDYVKAIPPSPPLARKLAKSPELQDTHDFIRAYLTPQEYTRVTPQGLQAIHDALHDPEGELPASPEDLAAMASAGIVKKGWYEQSGKAFEHIFGDDAPRFGALLAALSPQTSVEMNLTNALNLWKNWDDAGRPQTAKSINKIAGASVLGNKGQKSVLGAWKNNILTALTDDDPANIVLSGPKVNSFAANLRGVMNELTNDSWMAKALGVSQGLFSGSKRKGETAGGKGPGYLAANAQIRSAVDILNKHTGIQWTPAEVQETVWSWAKAVVEARREGLFNDAEMPEVASKIEHPDIAGTPDFSTMLHNPRYADILREAGYGPQLDTLQGKGLLFGTTAPDAARAYGTERLGPIARRLEQQYQTRTGGFTKGKAGDED